MKAFKSTGVITSALTSAALLISPLALAGSHGDRDHHGKRDLNGWCEKLQDGDWEARRDHYREKYDERHEAVADRLELTDEQRATWDEMREERQQKHERRFEKMKERCESQDQE